MVCLTCLDLPHSTVAEPCHRFLLKYASRDSVTLLGRGKNGVSEARHAITAYTEASPLYGLIIYRRRKTLIKYIPEGTSRLLQGTHSSGKDAIPLEKRANVGEQHAPPSISPMFSRSTRPTKPYSSSPLVKRSTTLLLPPPSSSTPPRRRPHSNDWTRSAKTAKMGDLCSRRQAPTPRAATCRMPRGTRLRKGSTT